ncbi:hypothetical protein ACVWZL_002574 [Bradyrhizobium sp. GM2.4]
MHLIWPDVSALHRFGRAGNGSIDVALVDQRARRRWIGAQRVLDVGEIGQFRRRLPAHRKLLCRADRVLLALRDDADEIADAHDGYDAGNVAHRGFIDRNQACADERAGVDAGIGRTHHAAVQHAGYADVVHEGEPARGLGREVDAGHRLADNGVIADRLDGDVVGKLETNGLSADQLAIADAAIVVPAHESVFDPEIGGQQLQALGRTCDQEVSRLRGGFAQGNGGDLDGLARDRGALVRHRCGVAEHDDDAGKGHIQLLGHDLAQRRADAGAEIDMSVVGHDRAVRGDADEGFGCALVHGADDDERAGLQLSSVRMRGGHQSPASAS